MTGQPDADWIALLHFIVKREKKGTHFVGNHAPIKCTYFVTHLIHFYYLRANSTIYW